MSEDYYRRRAQELHRALYGIMALIDNGTLVRNMETDNDPGWAMRQLPLLQALQAAKDALDADL